MNAHQRRIDRRAFHAWRAREAAKPKEFDWSTSAPPPGFALPESFGYDRPSSRPELLGWLGPSGPTQEALRARPNHWLGGCGPLLSADGACRDNYELPEVVDYESQRLKEFSYGPTVLTWSGKEGA